VLIEVLDVRCLPDGNVEIIIMNSGVSSLDSSKISVTKDGSPLAYGQFTIDKARIEQGSVATIKVPCTTPGISKICRYTIDRISVSVVCGG